MEIHEVFAFKLSMKEAAECQEKKLPTFLWYRLEAEKQGQGQIGFEQFIANRIKKETFSENELNDLSIGLSNLIWSYLKKLKKRQGRSLEELDRLFKADVYGLFESIKNASGEIDSAKRKKKTQEPDQRNEFLLRSTIDGNVLRPSLVKKGHSQDDPDCLYFEQCKKLSQKHRSRLDCRFCPNQNLMP